MSRYQFTNSKGLTVIYGYDRPLSEYFLDVIDPSIEIDENALDDSRNIVCEMSSYGICALNDRTSSNSEMFEAMKKHEVPEEALNCVAQDLPIP